MSRLIEICENDCSAKESENWPGRDITRARQAGEDARQIAVEQLKEVRYFWKHAHWLTERFPEAKLRDVEGLVKLVDRSEIESNDWSLTPGRYVGVAPKKWMRNSTSKKPCAKSTWNSKTSTQRRENLPRR
jgi:type I restriction enzyme M protein